MDLHCENDGELSQARVGAKLRSAVTLRAVSAAMARQAEGRLRRSDAATSRAPRMLVDAPKPNSSPQKNVEVDALSGDVPRGTSP